MSLLPGHLRAAFAQARNDHDWYVEPASCVHQLFDAVQFEGTIHDPCCGKGTIPNVASERGYHASGSDIVDRGYRGKGGFDWDGAYNFFYDPTMRDNIVSNPPYKLAEEMFAHACRHAALKVAFVLRISFLAGQKRRDRLFKQYRPSEVIVLSQRPSMPPGGTGVPAKGGTADYVWLVWDRAYFGPTTLRWI